MGSMLELLSAKSTEYLVMTKTQTRIRSFVTQRAHITPGQARALQKHKPIWGLPYQDQPVDLAEVFGRDAPTSIEVGSGMGEATIEITRQHPDENFIAIESFDTHVASLFGSIQ